MNDDDRDWTRPLPSHLDPRGPAQHDSFPPRPGPPQYQGPPHQGPPPAQPPVRPVPPVGYQRPGPPPAPYPVPTPRRNRRRVGKIIALVVVALLLAAGGFALYLDLSLNRENVLAEYDGRPADTPGTTWLLVGSDSREDLTEEERGELATGYAEGKRTDTIMILHIPEADHPPTLVSLPRDTLVSIDGHGAQKLNAAYTFGGGELLTRTVETITGLRMDHYTEIGLGGFAAIVDSVGGVHLCLDEPMNDPKAGLDLPAGCQDLNGAQALGYVRTRASANADLDRVQRQRQFLSALLSEVATFGTLANPFTSIPLALAVTDSLIVDDDVHLWHLASLGSAMGADDLVTSTVPISGTPTIDGVGSVVKWDTEKALAFFDALAKDQPVPAELITT